MSELLLGTILRFFSKIRARDESDLVRMALSENIAQEGKWSKKLMCVVKRATGKDASEYMDGADWINVDDVLQDARKYQMNALFKQANDLAKRNVGVHGITMDRQAGYKVFAYLKWFSHCEVGGDGSYAVDVVESYASHFWYHLNRRDQVQIVAQFRLGVHWLAVETGRFGPFVPRAERICPLCSTGSGQGVIEDEWHLLQCPAYEQFRCQHINLFQGVCDLRGGDDQGFRAMMNPPEGGDVKAFWRSFATFLTQCKWHRNSILMLAEKSAVENVTAE
jgi:hypothetical protein